MRSIGERLQRYAVKIKVNNDIKASGVLIKVSEEVCYLMTAKHNFKEKGDKDHKGVTFKKLSDKLNDISISKEDLKEDIYLEDILFFEDELDLVVFSLKDKDSSYINNLSIVKVLENNHQIKEYSFYGYPRGAEDGLLASSKYLHSDENKKYIFKLNADKNIDDEGVEGYSGSGVFIENVEEIEVESETISSSLIYLVGILIKAEYKLSYYQAIDLSKVVNKINKKIDVPIPIVKDVIDIDFSENIKARILNRNSEDTFTKRVQELSNNEKELFQFLEESESELTTLTKKLSDYYLLGAMLYNNSEEKATNAKKYFKLATKFNSKYKRYEKLLNKEAEVVIENSINHYNNGIIAFHHKKYDEAKEAFIKHISDVNIEDFEKLESYKYLSEIFDNQENYIDALKYGRLALDLYEESNILEKSEMCYSLFMICKKNNQNCALEYIDIGLDYIGKSVEKHILEIKYKLEVERDKLKGSSDNKTMNSTLLQLVKENPEKYINDFLEEYFQVNEGDIKNEDIYRKLKELHLDVIQGMKNNEKKD